MSHRAWLAVVLVVVSLGALATPATAAPACADCLKAGAIRVPLELPSGVPLGGYGSLNRRLKLPDVLGRYPHAFWFRPSQGVRDALAVRALVLEHGGRRLAWATLDLIAVDRSFTADAARALAATSPATTLLVSASHTHSGPGAFVDSEALGWLALDRLDPDIRQLLLDTVVEAVRRADAALRPARVAVASVTAPHVVSSRLNQPLDQEVIVLRVTDAEARPLGLLWNFAIHGTTLGPRNLRLSADVTGEASNRLERDLGVPVLFVNGAVGDVSPAGHGDRAAREIGSELATVVQAGWARAEPVRPALATVTRTASLPTPELSLHNCLWRALPRWLTLPIGRVFPHDATLTAVAVGDTAWLAFPGELQTALGREIKAAGRGRFRHTAIAGLTNDYLGYFLTPQDAEYPRYVSCANLYGPRTGACLTRAAAELVRTLGRAAEAPSARVACDVDAAGK